MTRPPSEAAYCVIVSPSLWEDGLSQGGLAMAEHALEIIYLTTIIVFLICGIIATSRRP
jgi:hypothetical protein